MKASANTETGEWLVTASKPHVWPGGTLRGFGMKEQHVSSSEMDENICVELHREGGVSSGV